MIAFNSKPELKEELLKRNDYMRHSVLSERYGIPLPIYYLVDSIFEELPVLEARKFALEWVQAVPVGADLSKVWNHFAVWLLTDEEQGVIRFNRHQSIINVSELHQRVIDGETVSPAVWIDAKYAAWAVDRDTLDEAARFARAAAAWAASWNTDMEAGAAARAAAWAAWEAGPSGKAWKEWKARDARAWADGEAARFVGGETWVAKSSQAKKLNELLQSAPVLTEVN